MIRHAPTLLDLLSTQHGLIARRQAVDLGLAPRRIETMVSSGRWERVAPSVYGIVGHRRSWLRELWRAWLHAGPDAVVSHESAGRLHRWEQVPAGLVVLSVPRRLRHAPSGVRWHRVDDLTPTEVVQFDRLPVTSPVRTMIDLASVMHVASLRLLVEQQVVEKRVGVAPLGTAFDRLRRRGRPGVRRFADVFDDVSGVAHLSRSELERLADTVVTLAGLPEPVAEYPLPGAGPTGFVDRCWPDARLILEADGRTWHARRQQMRRDADRVLRAQAAGYETSRVLWEHCAHDPGGTAVTLRAIHDARLALLGRPDP